MKYFSVFVHQLPSTWIGFAGLKLIPIEGNAIWGSHLRPVRLAGC
jgi:hypothetical protein